MTHQQRMRLRLQSFVDGELAEAQRASLASHLERCGECAATLRRLQESSRLLADARPDAAALSPEAARALLHRALAGSGVGRSAVWRGTAFLSWGFATAVVTAAAAAVGWLWLPEQLPVRPPQRPKVVQLPRGVVSGTWLAVGPSHRTAVKKRAAGPRASAPGSRPSSKRGKRASGKLKKPAPALVTPTDPPRVEQRPRRARPPRYPLVRRPGRAAEPPAARQAPREPKPQPGAEAPAALAWASAPVVRLSDGVELVSGPEADSSAGPGGASDLEEAPAAGAEQLLVIVTDGRAPSPVEVTAAAAAAPGYARVSAVQPDAEGRWTWIAASISAGVAGPEQFLVLVGNNDGQGEEEENDTALEPQAQQD